MPWLFLIFIVVPVVEMLVLIEVGSVLGSLTTVVLVFLTALIGVAMLRRQGLSTFLRFNEKLNSGELPAEELLSGVFLVIAGAFLLTPGFVTDTLGFLFLVPPIRHALAQRIIKRGLLKTVAGFEAGQFYSAFDAQQGDMWQKGNVYEAKKRSSETDQDSRETVVLLDADADADDGNSDDAIVVDENEQDAFNQEKCDNNNKNDTRQD